MISTLYKKGYDCMKKNARAFLPIIFLLISVILLCSCNETALMSDVRRADYLFQLSEQYTDPDQYHFRYNITVDGTIEGQEYVGKVAYDEFYQKTDRGNENFAYKESCNDFTGAPVEYTYVDGQLYIVSNSQKTAAPIEQLEQVFDLLPYYGVYYDISAPVTLTCPPPKNDLYTMTQVYDYPELFSQVYEYLWWALPSYTYEAMEVTAFHDVYTFNLDGRIEKYEAYVEVTPKDSASQDNLSVAYVMEYLYDDFTLVKPEDVSSYNYIEDYGRLDDMIVAVNQLFAESRGSLESEYTYRLSGAVEDTYSVRDRITYRTTNQKLTYVFTSDFVSSDYSDTAISTYNGDKLITESQGSRTETPLSQAEAYAILDQNKDFLWLDRSMVKDILSVEDRSGRTCMKLALTDEYLVGLVESELYYVGYLADVGSVKVNSAELVLEILADRSTPVLDLVELDLEATFMLEGETVTFAYGYQMQVTEHGFEK